MCSRAEDHGGTMTKRRLFKEVARLIVSGEQGHIVSSAMISMCNL